MSAAVLVVEDDAGLREALCEVLSMSGFEPRSAEDGAGALEVLDREAIDVVVTDVQMRGLDGIGLLREIRSRYRELPVLLMTAFATVQQAVDAMRLGATDYLVKPFEAEVLVGKVASCVRAAAADSQTEVIAEDPATRQLLDLAARVAATDVTLMLTGESGVGKEVVARFVHRRSVRAGGPFVAVNCAAIPENMLEAVLFGYEKGAFTGAYKSCAGKFEQAQGGVLLLDEIAEMDLGLQAKLLRVLQEREVERLGGRDTIALDVRVIAATNRDLAARVAEGAFREDLYFRLNVFPLKVPALRERPGDIVPLARHVAARAAHAAGRTVPEFSAAAEARLREHAWPGNVRELDNVVQRALVLEPGDAIDAPALAFESIVRPGAACAAPAPCAADRETLGGDLRAREHQLILDALAAGGGSRKKAAERLGISPRTLRYKLAQMRDEGVAVPGAGA